MKAETLKTKVLRYLQEDIKYRDNDQLLVGRIIWDMMPDQNVTAKTILEDMFKYEKYPKPKSIERCSRLLQEKYPGLRGKKWVARQRKADKARTIINERLV